MAGEPKAPVTVLVSDLGNVLLPFEPGRAYRALEAAATIPGDVRACVHQVAAEMGFGRGESAPVAFYERVAAALGLRLDFEAFCRAWSDIFTEDSEVVALVRQARVRRRYLLSNTDPIHWEWIRRHHGAVLAPFDGLFPSHECGAQKPDPVIYRQVIRASGEPPEAHLFIDDVPEYVEGARAVGMQAVCFTSAEALRNELRRHGLRT